MRFGAHMPTRGGVHIALERAISIGADICQIFVKNNLRWTGKEFAPEELARFQQTKNKSSLASVFGHTGYLINLAAGSSDNREKSLQSLIQEIELAASLHLPFLVLHPGAHLGQGETKGLLQVVRALDQVFQSTRQWPVRIALENTAGQGTCLGARIEHLAEIIGRVRQPRRLGICLDTAHAFAAGHDLRRPSGWDDFIAQVERQVGLTQVLAFHLNDSKGDLGSHLDRHAGIGQGKLGKKAFSHIVNDPRFQDLPGCLETPKSADCHEDRENLAILRSLIRKKS